MSATRAQATGPARPWSVALTLNSERSVVVDLDDRRWQPEVWRTAAPPVLEDEVDRVDEEREEAQEALDDAAGVLAEAEREERRAREALDALD